MATHVDATSCQLAEGESGWAISTPNGRQYEARQEPLPRPSPIGQLKVIRLFEKLPEHDTWQEIPLRLSLRSRLTTGLVSSWPPETVDRLGWEQDELYLDFRDPWVPWEKEVLPFGWGRESLWRATLSARTRRWTLRRLRKLDYEHTDIPV